MTDFIKKAEEMRTKWMKDNWWIATLPPLPDLYDGDMRNVDKQDPLIKYQLIYAVGKTAYNPYCIPKDMENKGQFIYNPISKKVARNSYLRYKRRLNKQDRECVCGCGKIIPAGRKSSKKYYNDACRMRSLRKRRENGIPTNTKRNAE